MVSLMLNNEYLKRLNILYIEDEAEAANRLQKLLSRVFDNIFYCINGKEALDVFNKESIDLIISDINMPVMDGMQMASKIRESNKDIPIIFTTARNESDCLIKAIDLNVDSFILKPIDFSTLIDKVKKAGEKIFSFESKKLLEEYKDVVDKTSIVFKFSSEGKITFVNEKYEELTKYEKREVKNRFFNFNFLSSVSEKTFSEIWEKIENKETWRGKLKGKTKENKSFVLDVSILPVVDYNNNIIEYIAISNDITQEEAINELLQVELIESKDILSNKNYLLNEYKRCLDISSVFISINKNFKIINVNSKFLQLTKGRVEEYLGKKLEVIVNDKTIYDEIHSTLAQKKEYRGILTITNKRGEEKYIDFTFTPVFNELKEVVDYLAVGSDISELIELQFEIEDTQKDLILTLGTIGESRSKETANHVKRVALYSYLLAKEYGLSEEEANLLKMASPMHDIGKIGIPDFILNKPGKLTNEEYDVIKTHTTIGYNMFKNSNRKILRSASVVAYEHHEKWDGTGYPRGLEGYQIHIFGRITAVADVFDALISRRVYKESWSLEEVIDYMCSKAGYAFEPRIVDLLIKNLDKILDINSKYEDR
ncbi:HD domain-containing phosphohydrolase [Halarcobacter ebronensis]|uniref:Regulator n=1 Tax=Halarcobacter ebronensis TaxID=1462615 RepID=A0A4Q1AWY8_9BACT|nr:HD domain-containing phosphohydrolase [Halarcobacter ebronensis]QKF82616.1 multi-sensor domain-containing response regulator c-di-GMP phosphodiesterase, RpfG family [Halarcobacter ebronensis]RXK07376.1 regulator [Halarcobacter ebronensis]